MSRTHPAEINQQLGLAHAGCDRMIQDAEKRGDQPGADAWLVARNAIEAAERAMADARKKQTWGDDLRDVEVRCAACGNPKSNHHYRHFFVEWKPGMPEPKKKREIPL